MDAEMIKKLIEAWFYTEEVECTIVGATDIKMLIENNYELQQKGGFDNWNEKHNMRNQFKKWLEENELTDKY